MIASAKNFAIDVLQIIVVFFTYIPIVLMLISEFGIDVFQWLYDKLDDIKDV